MGVGSGVGKPKRCRFGVVLAAFLPKFVSSGGEFGVTCCTTFLACEMLNMACRAVKPTRFSRTYTRTYTVATIGNSMH